MAPPLIVSGEVNMIPTLIWFRGASLKTFFGRSPVKKNHPVFSRIRRVLNSDHVWNPLQARLSQCNWLECQSSAQGAPWCNWCNWCKHELHLWVHTGIKLCPHWTLVLFDNCLFACRSLLWPREDISICDNIKDSFTHQHWHQGCIFRLMCSHPELTEDHVLTSAYVKILEPSREMP